jgi:hypothetical protein
MLIEEVALSDNAREDPVMLGYGVKKANFTLRQAREVTIPRRKHRYARGYNRPPWITCSTTETYHAADRRIRIWSEHSGQAQSGTSTGTARG